MKVLLGIDASDFGYRALEETVDRASDAGDALTVAVYGPPDERAELQETVRARLDERGLGAEVVEIDEEPGPALVQLADSGPYDRLVIGGGVKSPMGKIQLGSVAEFVLTNATTSVTLVR